MNIHSKTFNEYEAIRMSSKDLPCWNIFKCWNNLSLNPYQADIFTEKNKLYKNNFIMHKRNWYHLFMGGHRITRI